MSRFFLIENNFCFFNVLGQKNHDTMLLWKNLSLIFKSTFLLCIISIFYNRTIIRNFAVEISV